MTNNDGFLLETIQNLNDVDLKTLVRWLSRSAIQAVQASALGAGPARTVNAVVQLLADEHVRRRVALARLESAASDDPARGLFLAEAVAGPLEGLRARPQALANGTGTRVLSGPSAEYLLRIVAALKDDGDESLEKRFS